MAPVLLSKLPFCIGASEETALEVRSQATLLDSDLRIPGDDASVAWGWNLKRSKHRCIRARLPWPKMFGRLALRGRAWQ